MAKINGRMPLHVGKNIILPYRNAMVDTRKMVKTTKKGAKKRFLDKESAKNIKLSKPSNQKPNFC
jgi:hypothetical protein